MLGLNLVPEGPFMLGTQSRTLLGLLPHIQAAWSGPASQPAELGATELQPEVIYLSSNWTPPWQVQGRECKPCHSSVNRAPVPWLWRASSHSYVTTGLSASLEGGSGGGGGR